jgi:tagatose-1,6-bisphosphate aldolase
VSRGPGTTRSLRALLTDEGLVAVVALDQRQALRRMLREAGAPADADALRAFKRAVARSLGDVAPALLVDPEYGLPAIAGDPGVPARLPLLVAVEESGTLPAAGGRRSLPLAGFDPVAARHAGAAAAKLLVYLRADHEPTRGPNLALAQATGAACRRADLPFVLELVPFPLEGEDDAAYAAAFGGHVLAAARLGAELEPDLLKLPWPGPPAGDAPDRGALAALAGLGVPWALLSAGAEFERFAARVLRALDEGGASGFIAGRALWQDAVGAADLDAVLCRGARERLVRLLSAVRGHGRPLPLPAPPAEPDWFRR